VEQKKYNGLELDEGTGGSQMTSEMVRLRGTVKGQDSARKPPSGRNLFLRADVTAEAVTYKARERARADRRRRGDQSVVEMIRLDARLGSQSRI
jgi:hypothetical protein